MEPMSITAIVGVALSAINSAIELYKEKTPDWEQKQFAKHINKQKYLTDMYEIELKKPRFEEGGNNENARSLDRLLNIRDQLLRHGSSLVDQLGSTEG